MATTSRANQPAAALPKARYGTPCNHCAQCCQEALCDLADVVFGSETATPCPALERDEEGRSSCGLVTHPMAYVKRRPDGSEDAMREAALFLTGAGLGCDYQAEGERTHLLHRWRSRRRRKRTQRNVAREIFGRLYQFSGRLRSGRRRTLSAEWIRILLRFDPPAAVGRWFRPGPETGTGERRSAADEPGPARSDGRP